MVTGSVAATFYGEPRFTQDVDLVVDLRTQAEAKAFASAFPDDSYYCAPEEVIIVEWKRDSRGHFNVISFESGFKADVYIAHDSFHRWALAHRKFVTVEDVEVPLAPVEYVIVRKLLYFREGQSQKHLDDIRKMLNVSSAEIDTDTLMRWVEECGLQTEWQDAQSQT